MECSNYEWPFQEPKWEVPTIFMAYVWAHNMVFCTSIKWILFKIPIEIMSTKYIQVPKFGKLVGGWATPLKNMSQLG